MQREIGLSGWSRDGLPLADALHFFDSLPAVDLDALSGLWQGIALPSGHPLDGLLEAYGWFGKRFDGPDLVHPLLLTSPFGGIYPLQPAVLPLGLAFAWPRLIRFPPLVAASRAFGTLLRARRPAACLRMVEHRGALSAAMIYDELPIIDHFRKIDSSRLLGLMTSRYTEQPLFFAFKGYRTAPGAPRKRKVQVRQMRRRTSQAKVRINSDILLNHASSDERVRRK